METFTQKRTKWEGLWWNNTSNSFVSGAFNMKALKDFKGSVRIVAKKNKFYEGGKNGRPNYVFSIYDAETAEERYLEVEDATPERLYTAEEVRRVISGVVADVKYGFTAPGDLLIEDYLGGM